ncbi:HK97 gp10 family phage protein (plasmid) [Deinococcus sp. D7000]|nr:HK97 gp10 family phage protein [Deinococcus sp. D7000]QLG13526.1 HK97 gp10 family phage protein [Deinococcus sp. D7000]
MSPNGASMIVPRWVKRLDKIPEEAAYKALNTSRDYLRDEARRNASKGGPNGLRVRSGRLLRSIRTYLKTTKTGGELSLGMAFYGWVHDRGAVIVPKKAGRLRFFIPGVGWRTAMRVVLPERRWARNAVEATQKKYPQFLRQAIRQAVRA